MPLFEVRVRETRIHTVIVEAKDDNAVREFCWGNYEMLCGLGSFDKTVEDNAIISEAGDAWKGFTPDVRLNTLQRVQDL